MGGNGGTKEDMRSTNYGVRGLEKLRPALYAVMMSEAIQDQPWHLDDDRLNTDLRSSLSACVVLR